MAFYRDVDGAIWQNGHPDVVYCIVDPDDDPNSIIGIPMDFPEVEKEFGPLVKVRPTGWEEI
jgi:hypothetical protein